MKDGCYSHPTADFRSEFQSTFDLYLVFTADLKIIAVCDLYLRSTKTKRNEFSGKGIFKVSPGNPEYPATTGARNLRSSLARVLQWKGSSTLTGHKYCIRKPELGG
jgi:hypothetical protein